MKRKLTFIILFSIIGRLDIYAQWSPEIRLTTFAMWASLNENAGPCLAVSGDTLHVVWSDHRTNGYAIYYERSIDTGMTWSIPIPITDTTGNVTMPVVAVSGSTVHVVWMENIQGVRASFYKRSLDGGNTWGNNVCLDIITAFWPGIAASGDTVVATLNKEVETGNTEVFIRISLDNGSSWGAEQQISNAYGRSEDPAIAVKGSFIHLSWNDKRSGIMQIYYRRSEDAGVTWGQETQLTDAVGTEMCYTSMVSLDGPNVDIPYGYNVNGNFDVWLRQSPDNGATFGTPQQLTNNSAGEVYPYLVRSETMLHIGYVQLGTGGGTYYLHSDDGGATWDAPFLISSGFQPFIVYTGCMLHVIYQDSGQVYYRVNPTGNCFPTGIKEKKYQQMSANTYPIIIYPNPANQMFTAELPGQNFDFVIYDLTGRKIYEQKNVFNKMQINCTYFSEGIYFAQAVTENHKIYNDKIIIAKN